jgi:hypothetical protein
MGIDFDGGASWSYGGYFEFRHRIARYYSFFPQNVKNMYKTGEYALLSKEPIYPLIIASDDEGKFSPRECKEMVPCLRTIIQPWKLTLDLFEDIDLCHDIKQGELLIKAMERCARCNKPLLFW